MPITLLPALAAALTVLATLTGGSIALRSHGRMHLVLGFSGGLLLGLVGFDLLPEVFGHHEDEAALPAVLGVSWAAVALVGGFITLHAVERVFGHHEPLDSEEEHTHDHSAATGVIGASALAIHVFLDGLALAVAFQVGVGLGLAVAVAVLAHAFSDGLNTVALLAKGSDLKKRGWQLLTLDGIARVSGALLGTFFLLDEVWVKLYLASFAGALIYLATSHILPEAHSRHTSKWTLWATFVGIGFMFLVVAGTSGVH